jgi:hypothetical protein
MDNPLVVSLIVTGIGMAVLFLALAILYGLMVLMTGVIRDRGTGNREQGTGSSGQGAGIGEQGMTGEAAGMERARWRAAAIGVALARAEQELGTPGLPGPPGTPSAWRALHQQRQLTLSPRPRGSR